MCQWESSYSGKNYDPDNRFPRRKGPLDNWPRSCIFNILSITYCKFEQLSVTGEGGALYLCSFTDGGPTLSIRNTVFDECSAKEGGGIFCSLTNTDIYKVCWMYCASEMASCVSWKDESNDYNPTLFTMSKSMNTLNQRYLQTNSQDTFRTSGGQQYITSHNSSHTSIDDDGSGFEAGWISKPSQMRYGIFANHTSNSIVSLWSIKTFQSPRLLYDLRDLILVGNTIIPPRDGGKDSTSVFIVIGSPWYMYDSFFYANRNSDSTPANLVINDETGRNPGDMSVITFIGCSFDIKLPEKNERQIRIGGGNKLLYAMPNTNARNVIRPELCPILNSQTEELKGYSNKPDTALYLKYGVIFFMLQLLIT